MLKLAAATAMAAACAPVYAASGTWTTNGGGNWSDTANWTGGIFPNAVDDIAAFNTLDLTSDANVTLDIAPTVGQLAFGDTDASSAAGWTVTGGVNALTLATSAGVPIINVGALGTDKVVTLAAVLAGAQGMDKQGAGTLVLTSANTYTGGTTITAGTLQIGNGGTTGSLAAGTITNNAALAYNRSNAITVADAIGGTGTVSQIGTGTLILTGANAYTGATNIAAGTMLQVGAGGAVGTLGATTINNSGTLTVNRTGLIDINTAITGTGNLVKLGSGSLGLAGNNTYSGTTTITAGHINYATEGSLSGLAANSITVGPAGSIGYAGTINDSTFAGKINAASTGTIAISNAQQGQNFDFTSLALAPVSNMSLGAPAGATIVYSGTITPKANTYRIGGGGGIFLYSGSAITGANSLVVGPAGGSTGDVVLPQDNTYTGTTTVNAGSRLFLGASTATAAIATGSVGTGNVLLDGQLYLNRTGSYTFANNVTGTGDLIRAAMSQTTTTTMSITGNVSVGGLYMDRGGDAVTITQVDGGTLTVSTRMANISNGGTGGVAAFVLNSGKASFNAGIGTQNNRTASYIHVNGGTFTASNVLLTKSGGGNGGPDVNTGFQIRESNPLVPTVTQIGTMTIGNGDNSWASVDYEGGTNTVTGQLIVSRTASGSRGGQLRVSGGTFKSEDTVDGIVLGRISGTVLNQFPQVTFAGGISTVEKFTMGYEPTLTGTGRVDVVPLSATVNGSLYVGSGGFVKLNAASTLVTTLNLGHATFAGGTLGAKANWSSDASLPLNIVGTTSTIKAADVDNNPFDITWNGPVRGTGTVTKTGGGTLSIMGVTLDGPFTGTTNVSAGTLRGFGASLKGNIVNNSNVVFDEPAGTTAYASLISGTGTLVKNGVGTTVLSNAAGQTYTGATTVNAGALSLVGTHASSGFTVNNGGGLSVANGNATIKALTLGASASDALSLTVSGGSGFKTLTVSDANGLVANGVTTFTLGAGALSTGEHTLIDYNGTIGGAGYSNRFQVNLPQRTAAALVHDVANTAIKLNVIGVDLPRWEGNVNNDWDYGTSPGSPGTLNWKEAIAGNATDYRQYTTQGEQVLFDDAATGTDHVVNLVSNATPIRPALVTVSNSADSYTFAGTGKISGSGAVLKQGTGTLTISNTGGNDYSGGTQLQSGTIVTGAADVLPNSGAVTVSGGTLDLGGVTHASGIISLQGGTLTNGTMNKASGSLDVQSGNITSTFALTGTGGLIKTGEGTVVVVGNGLTTYSGGTIIGAGKLQLGNGTVQGALPATNISASGTGTLVFDIDDADANPLTVDQTWSSTLTGTGRLQKEGSGTLRITAENQGNATINEGTVILGTGNGVTRLARGGVITVNSGGTVVIEGTNAAGAGNGPPAWQVNGGTVRSAAGADHFLYNFSMAGGTLEAEEGYLNTILNGGFTISGGVVSTMNTPVLGLQNSPGISITAGSTLVVNGSFLNQNNQNFSKGGPGTMILNGAPPRMDGNIGVTDGVLSLNTSLNMTFEPVTPNPPPATLPPPPVMDGALNASGTGTVRLESNGSNNRVIRMAAVTATGTSKIDLKDNKMIVVGGGAASTWSGTAYGGAVGLIASGYANGAWTGSGIITTAPGAAPATHLMSLGSAWVSAAPEAGKLAKAGQQFGDQPQALADGDLIVMFTYGGDADLNGKLDGDDYFAIDSSVNTPGARGWVNGDFDYNGKINGDDYFIIDSNIGRQTGAIPLFPPAQPESAALSDGVAAVPEPASLGLLAAGASLLLGRRRRRAAGASRA
ncbi:MAG TPA: autotransporter-associated beta strand repeat-containing protein [Tepidisphaeraceae bacterium]|nr:autotransporter-associated beta strand repeat-containing protein [Tepidisphaeraceae bacterium]